MQRSKRTTAATQCGWSTVIRPAVGCRTSIRSRIRRHAADIKWWQRNQCTRTVHAWIAATASGEFRFWKKTKIPTPTVLGLVSEKQTWFLLDFGWLKIHFFSFNLNWRHLFLTQNILFCSLRCRQRASTLNVKYCLLLHCTHMYAYSYLKERTYPRYIELYMVFWLMRPQIPHILLHFIIDCSESISRFYNFEYFFFIWFAFFTIICFWCGWWRMVLTVDNLLCDACFHYYFEF